MNPEIKTDLLDDKLCLPQPPRGLRSLELLLFFLGVSGLVLGVAHLAQGDGSLKEFVAPFFVLLGARSLRKRVAKFAQREKVQP